MSSEVIDALLSAVVDDSEVETEAEGDDLEEEIAPLTDQEKRADRQSRIEVLLRLLELACEMVRDRIIPAHVSLPLCVHVCDICIPAYCVVATVFLVCGAR